MIFVPLVPIVYKLSWTLYQQILVPTWLYHWFHWGSIVGYIMFYLWGAPPIRHNQPVSRCFVAGETRTSFRIGRRRFGFPVPTKVTWGQAKVRIVRIRDISTGWLGVSIIKHVTIYYYCYCYCYYYFYYYYILYIIYYILLLICNIVRIYDYMLLIDWLLSRFIIISVSLDISKSKIITSTTPPLYMANLIRTMVPSSLLRNISDYLGS